MWFEVVPVNSLLCLPFLPLSFSNIYSSHLLNTLLYSVFCTIHTKSPSCPSPHTIHHPLPSLSFTFFLSPVRLTLFISALLIPLYYVLALPVLSFLFFSSFPNLLYFFHAGFPSSSTSRLQVSLLQYLPLHTPSFPSHLTSFPFRCPPCFYSSFLIIPSSLFLLYFPHQVSSFISFPHLLFSSLLPFIHPSVISFHSFLPLFLPYIAYSIPPSAPPPSFILKASYG